MANASSPESKLTGKQRRNKKRRAWAGSTGLIYAPRIKPRKTKKGVVPSGLSASSYKAWLFSV